MRMGKNLEMHIHNLVFLIGGCKVFSLFARMFSIMHLGTFKVQNMNPLSYRKLL